MTDKEALLVAIEALHYCEALNRDVDERKMQAITVIRKLWTEHAMRETQRLGQEIEQEPVAHCEAGPNYCWKCLEESNPTYGSEEIKKLREVNKSLMKNIEELKKEPPPFWPVVQHLLDEYGLQFIDIVAAYRESTQPEQEPHGWYIDGYGAVIGTAEPKSVRVGEWLPWYTTPPQRTWVGLTEEERDDLLDNYITAEGRARAIEAKLKEKNT